MDETPIVPFSYTVAEAAQKLLNKDNKEKNSSSTLLAKKKKRRKGVPILLYVKPDTLNAIDSIVAMNDTTRTDWIKQCIMRGLKNWRNPLDNPTIWGPCYHCGKRHDPKVHG
jgi:hypothetical protein